MSAPEGKEQSLPELIEAFLGRRGGTVVQRLVSIMKKTYREDAPELESEETLKAFVNTRPELFKIIKSCNDVERVKLVNPPRRERRVGNDMIIDITMKLLKEMVRPKIYTPAVDGGHIVRYSYSFMCST